MQQLNLAAEEQRAAREETASLRRDARMREDCDLLEKKRRAAEDQKNAQDAKRQAAIQSLMLLREEAKTAEPLILCIWIRNHVRRKDTAVTSYSQASSQHLGIIHACTNQGGWRTKKLR